VWSIFKEKAPKWPPTFIAHGGSDDFISHEWGLATYEKMLKMGIPAEFSLVPGMHHDMVEGEIAELLQFLNTSLEQDKSNESRSIAGEL